MQLRGSKLPRKGRCQPPHDVTPPPLRELKVGAERRSHYRAVTSPRLYRRGVVDLGYRPEYCLDDVIVDFEEHDECIKNRLIQELINKMPNAIDRNDGYGIKELYAVHKIISKMED